VKVNDKGIENATRPLSRGDLDLCRRAATKLLSIPLAPLILLVLQGEISL
jgi:hypothetical protein